MFLYPIHINFLWIKARVKENNDGSLWLVGFLKQFSYTMTLEEDSGTFLNVWWLKSSLKMYPTSTTENNSYIVRHSDCVVHNIMLWSNDNNIHRVSSTDDFFDHASERHKKLPPKYYYRYSLVNKCDYRLYFVNIKRVGVGWGGYSLINFHPTAGAPLVFLCFFVNSETAIFLKQELLK